jgi:hypothetical protein
LLWYFEVEEGGLRSWRGSLVGFFGQMWKRARDREKWVRSGS